MTDAPLGEFDLIARCFRPLATDAGAFGLTDDAALFVPPEGRDLVLTKDAVVAGVHFLPDEAPARIARKALRVNLSDLFAKGAEPVGYLLSLALPDGWTVPWLDAFATGLGADQKAYGLSLFGGDTVRTPGPLVVSITCFGTVPHGAMLRRGGARPGDALYVTGTIGDAALGLLAARGQLPTEIDSGAGGFLEARYRLPDPPRAAIESLRAHASAAMDISDGLIGDLEKLCAASGAGACLTQAGIPLSAGARACVDHDPAYLETCLTGGDDYEILAAIPQEARAAFEADAARGGLVVTRIGDVLPDAAGVTLRDDAGRPVTLRQKGYVHR